MYYDLEKIKNTGEVLRKIAGGINPVNGEIIENNAVLNDTMVIRSLYFAADVLDNVADGVYSRRYNKTLKFVITPEQKSKVRFTEGKIGVNEFSRCINSCIDLTKSKKLTGVELNKRLKKLGILSEKNLEDGKTRTITNENSGKYGFESVRKSYNGVEYDMVVINDEGKKYLLDNIEKIMNAE